MNKIEHWCSDADRERPKGKQSTDFLSTKNPHVEWTDIDPGTRRSEASEQPTEPRNCRQNYCIVYHFAFCANIILGVYPFIDFPNEELKVP